MPEVFGALCRMFGYASCGSISTFDLLLALACIGLPVGIVLLALR
jgi:hypothetical protein